MSKKLAKVLFANRLINSDDEPSDSSDSSCESEQNSHVPIKNLDLKFNLTLKEEQTKMAEQNIPEGNYLQQLSNQLNALAQSINAMNNKQNQYEGMLAAINTRLDNNHAAPSAAHRQPAPSAPTPPTDLFRIPDPIKSIPAYDGSRKQLNSWLTTAENTLNIFEPIVNEQVFSIYLQAIINKIEGKAKDILCLAGNPMNFNEIKEILTNAIGDRQELSTYKSQLWNNKMQDNTSVHRYYQKTKETIQNIKTLSKQNQKYRSHWDAINDFIEQDALAAFIAGLREPYFGYAQAARPKDIEDAYAFLCKFKSKEITANNMGQTNKNTNQNFQKFVKPEKFNSNKPQSYNNTFENSKPEQKKPLYAQPPAQPMEIDPSLRSRLTLNKKLIHNNETLEHSDSSEHSDVEEENEVNFWQTTPTVDKT